jgi:tetratricopeptide (TPR) repeat protein
VPAIAAYIVLIVAVLFFWQRRQKSADWNRLLDTADRDSATAKAMAEAVGYEQVFGGKLKEKNRLRLRMRQLTVGIVLCAIIAVTLLAFAIVQEVSKIVSKTQLLDQMTATAQQLQSRLDIENVNKGNLVGDLGRLQTRFDIQLENNSPNLEIARLANELQAMRTRFVESVGRKYLTQRDIDALAVVDGTLFLANRDYEAANQQLSDELLNRLSVDAQAEMSKAIHADMAATAARMKLGNFQGAIESTTRILKIQPHHWFALEQRANARFQLGLYDEAISDLAAVEPSDIPKGVSWLYPTLDSMNSPDVRQQIELSNQINSVTSSEPFAFSFQYLPLLGRTDEPKSCEFATRQQREQFARIWLSMDLSRVGKDADAELLLEKAVQNCPNDAWALQEHGMIALRNDSASKAEASFRKLVLLQKSAFNYLMLGFAQQKQNKNEDALLNFSSAHDLAPEDADIVLVLDITYAALGRREDAIKVLSAFLNRRWDPRVAANLEGDYASLSRDSDVATIASQRLEHDLNNEVARSNRGLARYKLGQFEGALDDFATIVSAEPQNVDALFRAALSAANAQKYDVGLDFVEQLLKVDPDYPRSEFIKGQLLLQLHRFEDAISSLQLASTKNQALPYEIDYTLYFAYYNAGKMDDAGHYCDRLAAAPNLPRELLATIPPNCRPSEPTP